MQDGMSNFTVNPAVWTTPPKAKFGDVESGQRRAISAIDTQKTNRM